MIAFYWYVNYNVYWSIERHELIQRFSNEKGLTTQKLISLDKMKIPAICISVFLLVFEHVDSGVRAARITDMQFTVYVTGVITDAIALICTCYFLFNGTRLLRYLGSTESGSSALKRVRFPLNLLLMHVDHHITCHWKLWITLFCFWRRIFEYNLRQ
jgi:hypothetical protein